MLGKTLDRQVRRKLGFARESGPTSSLLRVRLLLGLLAIPVGAASQRWIEEPIRHGSFAALLPGTTLMMAAALSFFVAILSLGSAAVGSARLKGPVPLNLVPPLTAARDDLPRVYKDGCHLGLRDLRSGSCAYGDLMSSTTIVLLGDSHAAQWFPTLERLALQHHWRLLSLTKSGCSAGLVTSWTRELNRPYRECDSWRADVLARIAAAHPRLVFISHSRRIAMAVDDQPAPADKLEDLWQQALGGTIRRLSTAADAVVIIGDTPRLAEDAPVCVSSHQDETLACANSLPQAIDSVRLAHERAIAEANGATFIDPTPWFCSRQICPAVIGRNLVFGIPTT